MAVSMNLFVILDHPTVGPCDERSPELKLKFEKLSCNIVEIFCGDVAAATVFVERTVRQKRCSFGPCMFCGRMTKSMLMCGACQRIAVFGVYAKSPPKKSKQMTYFEQFEPQILKRAKEHKRKCFVASQLKKIQAVSRGWLVRHKKIQAVAGGWPVRQ